jgi:exodeoxyribonuclease V gamma subunit
MPGFKVYTSNTMEILVEQLADVLIFPLADPLASEVVMVQSKGMERWLSMELARRHGICTNVRFPYPIHFVQNLLREMFAHIPEHSPYEPAIMTWDIMEILPTLLDRPGFQTLKSYLEEGDYDLKWFQLAGKAAELFDQYLLFRPEMMLRWDRGLENHWQAHLWREIVKRKGPIHRAALYQQFLQAMGHGKMSFQNIPERISIFGISALPPFHIQILAALASVVDVHLFLMNPCREFWGDIVSDREMSRLTKAKAKEGKEISRKEMFHEDLYLETGNRLLASMGALGRDFFRLIGDIECEENAEFTDPGEETLLAAIQSDILNLKERNAAKDVLPFADDDDSIQIHVCHSPLREIEALQDALLGLMENNRHIGPDDILIMIPDIESYAPFIQAVFSIPSSDSRWIPFTIADRGLKGESNVVDTFLKILELSKSRYEASRVLDILESVAVRSRFAITEEDLTLIHHWVRETGIRWGIDGESKENLDLPTYPWNTWRAVLDRMLLGYALPNRSGNELVAGILPYGLIEGGSTEVLGHFLAFTEKLFACMTALETKRSLHDWVNFLSQVVNTFFSDDEHYLRDTMEIGQILQELSQIGTTSRFEEKVSLDVMMAWLLKNMKEKGFGAGFLAGGVTFCTILPMRSIPFKVIGMLGMNDDAYPRQAHPSGFDLMAASPRLGDRSRRMDDRYLFLEAILSARQKLYISYVGQSMKDNSQRPPSVLVSEVLDYVEEGFGETIQEKMIVHHRLQAFNPLYFSGVGRLFSYSAENLKAAQSALSSHRQPAPFITSGLSEPEETWKEIDLESLCYFFANPARFLLNRRLDIYLKEDPAIIADSEPFELNTLEQYLIKGDMISRDLEKGTLADVYPLMRASGKLPHGAPGLFFYDELSASSKEFAGRIRPYLEGGPLEPAVIDITLGGFHLTGRLSGLYGEGLLYYHTAKMKGRDRLRAWITHLVLNHLNKETAPCQTFLFFEDKAYRYVPVDAPESHLCALLDAYWQGLGKPIHFFPESSLIYAEKRIAGAETEKAMRAADGKWDNAMFAEKDNLYYQLCFRETDPLDNAFRDLAMAIYEPMLRYEETIKE